MRGSADSQSPAWVGKHVATTAGSESRRSSNGYNDYNQHQQSSSDGSVETTSLQCSPTNSNNLQEQTESSHSDQIPQALDRTRDLLDESYIAAPLSNESILAPLQVPGQGLIPKFNDIEEPRKRAFDEYQPPNKRRKARNGLDESAFGRLPSESNSL